MILPKLARPQRGRRSGHVAALLAPYRSVLVSLLVFSGIVNVMALAVSLFSLNVYDRVLTSSSLDTLGFLCLAVVLAIALSSTLEGVRQLIAGQVGQWLSERLAPQLLSMALDQRSLPADMRLGALRGLSSVTGFLATPTLFSVVDMLWVPIYLVAIYFLHPDLGIVAAAGAAILLALAWINERGTRGRLGDAQSLAATNLDHAEALVRNGEVIDALGMTGAAVDQWALRHRQQMMASSRPQHFTTTITSIARFVRYAIQVAVLAVGAWLVLDRQLTGGSMIAGSIIVGRLMAPIESSISYWRQFVAARHALRKVEAFCQLPPTRTSLMRLPAPSGAITVTNLTYVPPALAMPVLRNVSFAVTAGEMLALVGPSASGKTTLARSLIGTLQPTQGHVRLDGADAFDWMRSDLGPHIGYLPQDVELLPGSVRDNIARFRGDATDADVVAAAKLADCHEMILQLAGGYDMQLTDGGMQLSGGQRQRIGLARALIGTPRLVVLDEPNASLDAAGEEALFRALRLLKTRGVTCIVVSHRTNLLRIADKVLVLEAGHVASFGTARDVVAKLTRAAERPSRTDPPPAVPAASAINGTPAAVGEARA